MPIYSYLCPQCIQTFEDMIKLEDYQKPQACPTCGTPSPRKMEAPGLNFPGEDWMTKNLRVERQMRANRERAGKRSEERKLDGGLPTLIPNVGGEETKTWGDAARLASEKGLDPSGYVEKALKK